MIEREIAALDRLADRTAEFVGDIERDWRDYEHGRAMRRLSKAPRNMMIWVRVVTRAKRIEHMRWVDGRWWTMEGRPYDDADLRGWLVE